ncbi:MAG: AAA family ATPase, partial [Candidatus Limnocylindrales bacterium]
LFADLVAFTHYSEGRDPELVRETLTRYFEAAREVIERHGGQVEKFIGDAVMAEWGAPRTNEDDAERAVRAALEVVEAVRNLGEGLHARVAVLTGQAAVTLGATDQGMVAGDLVNTAARLQGVAPPDTVLVGQATMQAASGAIAFEEAGEQVLKGKAAPVPAWRALRVVGDTRGRGRGEGLEPPFVGRELELRLLKDLLHATGEERRPRLVSITGPGGIGKSRLAWEFEKYVDGLVEGIYWHRGRSPSYGDGIAFWALGEMVRRRARLVESDDEATTRERVHDMVEQFIDLADRDWVEGALLTLLGVEPPPPGGRDALFAAWRTFFERMAADSTTVLIFEDLQWADPGQLDFIDHLMEWAKGVPLLVVTLARPELLERRPGWGTSARSFNAIGLEPLTDGNMRELLLGLVPTMPDDALKHVLARADGIPLYAVETLRMLITEGRLVADGAGTFRPVGELRGLAIPDTLRALVASRLDSLEPEDRALIQDATVLGQTFDHRSLAHINGQGETAVEARLRALVKREILDISVDPRSPERGHYGFVQSVIREVAYETLSRRDRRTRHLAAARYYEAEGDEELAAVLATHYLAALEASEPGPEADALQVQARLSLRAAADRAFDLGSPDQALTHLEAALAITTEPAERAPMLLRAVDAATAAAEMSKAVDYARAAKAAYEEASDPRSALGAVSALASNLLDIGQLDEAVTLLERSVDEAEPYPEVQADLLARLARAYMRLTRDEEAVAAADRSIALAEPLLLDRVVAEAMLNKGASLMKLGRVLEPKLLQSAGADLAHEVGDYDVELRGRANLSVFLFLHDLPAATELRRQAAELAGRLGSYKWQTWFISADVESAAEAGAGWQEALVEADRLLAEIDERVARTALLDVKSILQVKRGEDASETIAELLATARDAGDEEGVANAEGNDAIRRLFEGRTSEALALARSATPRMGQNRILGSWVVLYAGFRLGDLEAVRQAEAEIREDKQFDNAHIATRALAAGILAGLEGRQEDAIEAFRAGVKYFDLAGWRYWSAHTKSVALAALPGEPAFDGWAEEARALFESVGAKPDLEWLDEALAKPAATGRSVDRPEVRSSR